MRYILVSLVFSLILATSSRAEEFDFVNGNVIKGEPVNFDADGMVVRLDLGGFQRVSWAQLTQDALKKVAENYPQGKAFAEPFIVIPPEEKRERKEIPIKPVERLDTVEGKPGLIAAITTPPVLFVLAAFFVANLYAAYQVAVYRHRPAAVVCGISAILPPLIGPLLFLATPTAGAYHEEETWEEMEDESAAAINPMQQDLPGSMGKGGLNIAKSEAQKAESTGPKVFKRGDYTFNRRFFETQFAGFFRMVPKEGEKDLVLIVKTAKSNYTAKRIARISTSDVHLQLANGGEHTIGLNEITEVHVRHKDDRG